jgi:hypothetical protein
MANSDPAFVESEIDLPDHKTPVTVALESKGVSFVAFQMDLVMDDAIVRNIVTGGTEEHLGKNFALGNALGLRGMVLVCRGFVGAAAAGTIRLRCVFRFDLKERVSDEAVVKLTSDSSSGPFRIRCEFV